MKKQQKIAAGDLVKIDLGQAAVSYARALERPLFAFYDCQSQAEMPVADIVTLPVIFKIWVMDSAVKSGRWSIVGNVELSPDLLVVPTFFIQDPIRKDKFRLRQGQREWAVSREDCVGLERASVWDAEHVEDRLRDHYAGQPNKWVRPL